MSDVTFVDSKLEKLKKKQERKQRPILIKKELQRRAYLRQLAKEAKEEEERRKREQEAQRKREQEAQRRKKERDEYREQERLEKEQEKQDRAEEVEAQNELQDYVQKYIRDYSYNKKLELKAEAEEKLNNYAAIGSALSKATAPQAE